MTDLNVTPEQLKVIAYERKITSWTAYTCATCDYPIKYRFSSEHPEVLHDPGCTCSDETTRNRYIPSSYEQLALYINSITDLELVKQTKEFWKI